MGSTTRGLQALALIAVAGLLGVLVWRIAHRDHAAVPVVIDPHHPVTSPAFDLPRLAGGGKLTLASTAGRSSRRERNRTYDRSFLPCTTTLSGTAVPAGAAFARATAPVT